jgi:hypothetical protein
VITHEVINVIHARQPDAQHGAVQLPGAALKKVRGISAHRSIPSSSEGAAMDPLGEPDGLTDDEADVMAHRA